MNRNIYSSDGVNPNDAERIGNLYQSGGQAGSVYDSNNCGPCLPGFGAGGGGKELKVAIPINTMSDGSCRTLKYQYQKNNSLNFNSDGDRGATAVAIPVLTPDRVNKRQNGRRFKEDGDPSFTLTSQDRHGVAIGIDDLYSNREVRLYEEEIPTLRSERQGLKVATNNVMPEVIGGIGEKNFGKQYRQGNRVYDSEKVATSLEASPVGNIGGNSNLYAIKVEPLEISSNIVSESSDESHTLNCNDQRKVFGAKQARTMVGYNFIGNDNNNKMFIVDKSVETRKR